MICCVLMCFGGVEMAQAQSLKDILNSSKVKDVVNLVTGNVIKFSDLQGTWNYVSSSFRIRIQTGSMADFITDSLWADDHIWRDCTKSS